MKHRLLIFSILFLLESYPFGVFSQNNDTVTRDSLNNKSIVKTIKNPVGTEFWLCFQKNYKETGNSSSDKLLLELFISGDWDAKVHIDIDSIGFHLDTLLPAETVINVKIPSGAQIISSERPERLAIHITSDNPISVYGLNRRFQTTDTYLGLPVNVLGKEYRAMCYTESKGLVSQIAIVATENGTKVSIVPTANTQKHPKGIEYSVRLRRGQVYQIIPKIEPFSNCDLTGTFIKANKRIAVFSGHQCSYVPKSIIACNHLVEQLPPIPSWGRHFYLGTFKSRFRYTYRVLAHHNDTKVFENNDLVAELKAGEHFEKIDNRNIQITATKPILVAQYSHGLNDGDSIGDPMMILVSPTQQFLKSYRFATPVSGSWHHYVNVVVPTASINNIILDGKKLSSSDFEQIGISRYSIGKIKVPYGTHTITGEAPFGMYSYGFGFKGSLKDDQYDAYGTMGGQSFIEYEIEKDTLPPVAELKYDMDTVKLIIRDDRVEDSGIREVRAISNLNIEAEVDKIITGMPQTCVNLIPIIPELAGKVIIETIDVALNKSLFTICYNFDIDQKKFTFYLTEGTDETCEVDPGIQIGIFGNMSANINIANFSESGNWQANGKFGNAFGFAGFGGLIIGRHLEDNEILSARIILENNPVTLEAPDDSLYKVRDTETNELRLFQEASEMELKALFLSLGFAYEWYLKEQVYFLGGINFSFPLSKEIEVKRKILIPAEWTYEDESRLRKDTEAPEELNSISTLRFSIFGGAGFNYNFNYRLSAFTEVIFNHYFVNLINDGDWGLEQFVFHLGLRYRFY
jgi:hypothetical protein